MSLLKVPRQAHSLMLFVMIYLMFCSELGGFFFVAAFFALAVRFVVAEFLPAEWLWRWRLGTCVGLRRNTVILLGGEMVDVSNAADTKAVNAKKQAEDRAGGELGWARWTAAWGGTTTGLNAKTED